LASTRVGVAAAALALSVLAGSSTIGRLVGGWIMLKVSALRFALVLMLMQAAGLAVLAVAEDRDQILLGTVVFGVTMGNSLMLHPLLLAERFGTRDYGRIYSTSQLVTVVGVASCPVLIGVLYEASGDYAVPFLAATAVTMVGFAVLGLFGTGRR
jgi:predicted MFS family arabinose efflux permease